MSLRLGELLVIGFILLVVFSAARMGQLGNALGKFIYSLRKAAKGQDFVDIKPGPPARRREPETDADYSEPTRRA